METTQQKYQSLTTKEQLHIVRRLLGFAAQYRQSFLLSMVAVLVQSVMNMLLPRFLQHYMDTYLVRTTLAEKIIIISAAFYLLGVIIRSAAQFTTTFAFNMGSEYML